MSWRHVQSVVSAVLLVLFATMTKAEDEAPYDGVFECSLTEGCPVSSMAWASGLFTEPGILTPSVFSVNTTLTLRLSLCCGYLFNGTMLRNAKLYQRFIRELLAATPFHRLAVREMESLLPRDMGVLIDAGTRRVFRYNTTLTAEDELYHNDGDGHVLELSTNQVPTVTEILRQSVGLSDTMTGRLRGQAVRWRSEQQ